VKDDVRRRRAIDLTFKTLRALRARHYRSIQLIAAQIIPQLSSVTVDASRA
jgi:hypothetical protein